LGKTVDIITKLYSADYGVGRKNYEVVSRIWKDRVMTYFKILPLYLPYWTEEIHKHAQPVMAKVQIICLLDQVLLTALSFYQPTQQT
jgi:hypothetical protein